MKFSKTVVIIFGVMLTSLFSVKAQNLDNPVLDTFDYQGELIDAGSPANGEYDFTIRAESNSQGPVGLTSMHTVDVVNGLFILEDVDLGANRFSDATELFLRVSVRKTADGGAYTPLSPSQYVSSVPYASQLISGDATNGQVLTFDGDSWQPQDLPVAATPSPWADTLGNATFTTGKVGIGTTAPFAALTVVNDTLPIVASFDGADNNKVVFRESGTTRGSIGSIATVAAEDFAIATPVASTGKIHLAPQDSPVLTATTDGFVGIGITSPTAALHVKNDIDSSMVANFDGGDNSYVVISEEGIARGLLGSVGAIGAADFSIISALGDLHLTSGLFSAPSISIKVADSETTIRGNTKQPLASNGMMKYMASISNCGDAGVSLSHSYNGVDSDAIVAQNDAGGVGSCELVFTSNIDARYIQATVTGGFAVAGRGVTCSKNGLVLGCTVFSTLTGNEVAGSIDVLIY